jgi:hypothetical protein
LVCEMIAQGDIILMDPEKLILPIGNLGARVTLFYLNLEGQLHSKRYSDSSKEENREVKIPEFNNIFTSSSWTYSRTAANLEGCFNQVMLPLFFTR